MRPASMVRDLHTAAESGELEWVEAIVDAGVCVDPEDAFYQTPLHFACFHGHMDVVKFLVEHGADVNARDEDGDTPFFDSVRRCHPEITEYLLDHGADPEYSRRKDCIPCRIVSEDDGGDRVHHRNITKYKALKYLRIMHKK